VAKAEKQININKRRTWITLFIVLYLAFFSFSSKDDQFRNLTVMSGQR